MIFTEELKPTIIQKAEQLFNDGYACSQSVLLAFAEHLDIDDRTAKLISSTFGGGMGRLRDKCGALTGGFMAIGLAMGNELPNDMDTKLNAYRKVRELDQHILSIYDTTLCRDILKDHATKDEVEKRKHHQIVCHKVVIEATSKVFDILAENEKSNN